MGFPRTNHKKLCVCVCIIWVNQCLDFSKGFDNMSYNIFAQQLSWCSRQGSRCPWRFFRSCSKALATEKAEQWLKEAGPLIPPPTWTRATLLLSVCYFIISEFKIQILFKNKVLLLRNNLETTILDDKMQTQNSYSFIKQIWCWLIVRLKGIIIICSLFIKNSAENIEGGLTKVCLECR